MRFALCCAEVIEVLGDVSVTVDMPGKRAEARKSAPVPPCITTDGTRLGAVVGAHVDRVTFQVTA